MNCEICFKPFDHTIHQPYHLACTHTYCLSCLKQLSTNKCPTCNKKISERHLNIELLKLIPESRDTPRCNNQSVTIFLIINYVYVVFIYIQTNEVADRYIKQALNLIRLDSFKRVEGILLLDKVIQVYPNYSETYFNKGNVLTDLTRFKEAIKCYNKAIELNPNHVLAYFNKDKALAEKNKNSMIWANFSYFIKKISVLLLVCTVLYILDNFFEF